MMGKMSADAQTLSAVCEQLILMISAGMPLHESIEALAQSRDVTAPLFDAIKEPLRDGATLAAAMEASGCFPSDMVGMLRAGEEAGRVESVLAALAAHYARTHRLKMAALDAVRYPLTLMWIIALVIFVLIFQVTPILEQALCSVGAGMDCLSSRTLLLSRIVSIGVGALCIVALLGAAVLVLLLRDGRHPALRRKLMMLLPSTARVKTMQSAQRVASMLSVLLRSGVPMERALEMLEQLCDTPEEKQRVHTCCQMMAEGESFSDAIKHMELFEPMYIRMIQAGSNAGQMDTVLEKTAQMILQEIDDVLVRLIGKIEPTLMVIMGLLIGAVLFSVMAPLVGMISAIA